MNCQKKNFLLTTLATLYSAKLRQSTLFVRMLLKQNFAVSLLNHRCLSYRKRKKNVETYSLVVETICSCFINIHVIFESRQVNDFFCLYLA